jgi:hypothetical protein
MTLILSDVIYVGDVRVIQRCYRKCLLAEAMESLSVLAEL